MIHETIYKNTNLISKIEYKCRVRCETQRDVYLFLDTFTRYGKQIQRNEFKSHAVEEEYWITFNKINKDQPILYPENVISVKCELGN